MGAWSHKDSGGGPAHLTSIPGRSKIRPSTGPQILGARGCDGWSSLPPGLVFWEISCNV